MSLTTTNIHDTDAAKSLIRKTEGDLDQELAAFDILKAAEAVQASLQKLAPAARAEAKRLLTEL